MTTELVIGSINNDYLLPQWNLLKKDSINIYDDPSVRFASTPYGEVRLAKLCDGMSYRLRLQRAIVAMLSLPSEHIRYARK